MARMPRLFVEGCAQHIVQRGNNRSVCFFAEADYAFYCQKLKGCAEKYEVSLVGRVN
jgi:putative transposase